MAPAVTSIDEVPVNSFHRRIIVAAMGGPFCDGYMLGIIAAALVSIKPQMHLGALWLGLIASSALIGLFAGGLLFGPVTDRIGRQTMYVINLAVFVLLSAAQFFVHSPWQLLTLRLAIGVAIGADYPIATALTTELVPRKLRGPALSTLMLAWWVGTGVSYAAGWAMSGLGPQAWRWMLLSGALPAAIFLLLRTGIPESPRWLAAQGRTEEAIRVVRAHFGPDVGTADLVEAGTTSAPRRGSGLGNIGQLFRRGYGRQLTFCSVFWFCMVAPSFALRTFQPSVLKSLGVHGELMSSTLIMVLSVGGVAIGLGLVNRIGRRALLIASLGCMVGAFLLLSVLPLAATVVVVSLFAVYNIAEAGGSGLQFVYPNELFPTDLRGTGMGFVTAMSRIGAAGGTLVLPLTIDAIGTRGALLVAAGIVAAGLVASIVLAPETSGLSLAEASRADTRTAAAGRTGTAPAEAPVARS